MPEPELSLLFIRPLNRLGVRYLISESVAAILYGEPRLTHDVDFVVFLRADHVPRLREMFPLPEFYLPRRKRFTPNLPASDADTSTPSTPTPVLRRISTRPAATNFMRGHSAMRDAWSTAANP